MKRSGLLLAVLLLSCSSLYAADIGRKIDQEVTVIQRRMHVARRKFLELKRSGEIQWKKGRSVSEEVVRDLHQAYAMVVSFYKQARTSGG